MTKKDFSNIGNVLKKEHKKRKPNSLSEMMDYDEKNEIESTSIVEPVLSAKPDKLIRECISVYKSDQAIIDELIMKCATAGQKATKADIYRASLKHIANLSPSVIANKVSDIRKLKKTHN